MPDFLTPKARSEIMSRIRSKGTRAEAIVFRHLRREGIYFQKHYSRAPGKPDIALPRKKKAVFIDGDFWHGRDIKRTMKRLPRDYWQEKIRGNYERDKSNIKLLRDGGWKALRVWESDINRKRTREQSLEKIKEFLTR